MAKLRIKFPWNRAGLRTYLTLIALFLCRADHRTLAYGLPLLVLGIALQIYAKGCLQQDQVLAVSGPYGFVRHPFYLANLLIDASIAVMSGWWPLMLVFPLWWLAVYLPVMAQEDRHLATLFPNDYPAYRKAVPALLPFRRPVAGAAGGFSWKNRNIAEDTVIPRALRFLSFPLILFLAQEIKGGGIRTLAVPTTADLMAASAAVLLYGLSRLLTRHLVAVI